MENYINVSQKGHLILIGGAEDKQRDRTILRRVIETANGRNVIIIPTASAYPREVADTYYDAFRDLNLTSFEYFDIRYPDEAERDSYIEKLNQAHVVYFSGGDQVKLVRTLKGTKLMQRIKERFWNERLTIAGTSAGAAAASSPMIYDGDYKGLLKGTVNHEDGFGLLNNITVDTHFLARERIARLTQFLLTGKSNKGIGIDEDTGIIISPDMRFEVIGSGVVTVINTDKITYNNYDEIEANQIYSSNNIRIGFLAAGTVFSTRRWIVLKSQSKKKKEHQLAKILSELAYR